MPESARSRNVLGSAFLSELKDLFGDKADFSENLGKRLKLQLRLIAIEMKIKLNQIILKEKINLCM